MCRRLGFIFLLTIFICTIFIVFQIGLGETAAATKIMSKDDIVYPYLKRNIKLGMLKNEVIKAYKNELTSKILTICDQQTKPDSGNCTFIFNNDKLIKVDLSFNNEEILDIPEKYLDKKCGKGKGKEKKDKFVTEWNCGNVSIKKIDHMLSNEGNEEGSGDSNSSVVIEYIK